jgi:chaperone protein EcpD
MFRNIFCISLLATLISCQVQASIVMNNTRVIYNARDREVTVPISNRSSKPVLVQSWIDNGDAQADPSTTQMPFLVIPPITRVDGASGNTLRVIAVNPATLPRDKESVFWLNVLDVPTKVESGNKNRLQVALQSRIKLFYRPDGLRGLSQRAPAELIWRSTQKGLEVSNPTDWYVSLVSVTTHDKVWPLDMVAPGQTREFSVPVKRATAIQVTWVDDNGATQRYDAVTK